MKRISCALIILAVSMGWLLPALSGSALAAEPREVLKNSIEAVLAIVSDPALSSDARAIERRNMLRDIVSKRFAYDEMARRSLATHWKRRSADERAEFMKIFARLLEKDYAGKLEAYEGEKIVYGDQQVDGDYAVVKTAIKLKHEDVGINYKFISTQGDWKVYDVLVEGMSLINNFRSQFNKIIFSSSYDELVKKMKLRVADLEALEDPKSRNSGAGN